MQSDTQAVSRLNCVFKYADETMLRVHEYTDTTAFDSGHFLDIDG